MTRRRAAGLALILGAIANSFFLYSWWAGSTLNPRDTFVSELASSGQPGAMWYRISDVVTGTLLISGILLSWTEVWNSRWTRVAQISTLVLGFFTALDSLIPLDCVPSIDRACRAAEEAGTVSIAHQMHSVSGVIEGFCLNLTIFALAFGVWRVPPWGILARVALGLGVVYFALNVLISYQYLDLKGGLGIVQRLQIVMFSALIAAVGAHLLSSDRRPFPVREAMEPGEDFTEEKRVFDHSTGSNVRVQVHHRRNVGPRVVFTNGLGLPLDHWYGVVAKIDATCILFDRPGLGGSEPWQVPPDRLTGELDLIADVITEYGDGPVVLVGHSWGGVLAESLARTRPDMVAGMVLVDPADPYEEGALAAQQTRRPDGTLAKAARRASSLLRVGPVARPLGAVASFFADLMGTARHDAMQLGKYSRDWFRDPEHIFATLTELVREPAQAEEAVLLIGEKPLPDIPILHLVGATGGWPLHRRQTRWLAQAEARARAEGWRLVELDGAHLLMLDHPASVAQHIGDVVAAVRQSGESQTADEEPVPSADWDERDAR